MDELQERIADDERHAEKMRKAADYDRLAAELDAAHAELETVSTAHDIMADAYNALSIDFAALRAAGEWRPVTDDEPADGEMVELLARGYRDGGPWYYRDDNPIVGWRPVASLGDAAQEPTP